MAGVQDDLLLLTDTSPNSEHPAGNEDIPEDVMTQPAVIRQEFVIEEQRDVKKREKWSFNVEFILACVGYSVTYANVWRLPYLMYRHGGISFLYIYIFFSILIAVPMFYLQTCLGQFWGKGPFHVYKICPIFRGLGVSLIVLNFLSVMYSNSFLAWFAYYGVYSLFKELPWASCNNAWNTADCVSQSIQNLNSSDYYTRYRSAANEFLYNEALRLTDGINNLGVPRWQFVVPMLIICGLMFAALCLGIKILGKILFVTVCLPILILFILFIRGVTLPGGPEGVKFLLYPNWTVFARLRFYTDGLTHTLFTFTSPGVFQTLASYNKFNAPCLRNAFIVMTSTIGIGVLSGLSFMSLYGALAVNMGTSFDQVVGAGFTLVFEGIPEILATLPAAQFWCFLLFVMMFLLGFTHQILSIEVFITTIMDIVPKVNRLMRIIVTLVVCGLFFLLSIPFLTEGGLYLITFFDWFLFQSCLWIFISLECIIIVAFYGLDQLSADIQMMTGLRPPIVYKFLWAFILPTLCILGLAYTEVDYFPIRVYGYVYPQYINSVGYFFSTLPYYPIVIFVIVWCVRSCRSTDGPLEPDLDCRPATDRWMDYELNQRKMERSVLSNIKAVFKI